jgi:dTDP-4-amino-4,6-dideoxygalactose transaminase
VPLADLDLGEEEIAAVTDVLRSGWLSMGPVTAEFERRFAAYIGVKYAFAFANCTAALHLAHVALGAGPGDKILCPSLTFVATANAIRYTGATPVFADITGADDFNISPEDIAAKIDKATKGICVVHYGGYPCDMDRIMRLAQQHGLYVVEDAAHAPGAACLMDARLLRSHGMTTLTWDRHKGHSFSYDVVDLGYNYRIDELRAALGMVQLQKLDEKNSKRAEITNIYRETLQDVAEITCPFLQSRTLSSHHLFPVLLRKNANRYDFMQFLQQNGIQTSIHYPPVHTFSHYKTYSQQMDVPITDDVAARVVTLPLYPGMQRTHVNYIVDAIKKWSITAQ